MRRDPSGLEHFTDCGVCMKRNTITMRQYLGCGLAPPGIGIPVDPWTPPGYKGPLPTVCPGYTTKLPEVIEVARARFHWDKGALAAFCDGAPPTETTMLGIEMLAGAVNEMVEWRNTPAKDGGGRD